MEILNLIDKETLSRLPPIFQTLKVASVEDVEKAKKRCESQYITIDFYQTNAFTPYSTYKCISKIFLVKEDESK